MDELSRVTVTRNSAKDVKQRQMIIKLDGEPFATLMFGDSVTREVKAGRHRLRVDNTWVWKTVEFKLEPGEHREFRVISRTGLFTWWMVAVFGAGPMYVTIEQ
ncbi:MAG: hypothetical protein M3O35_22150 [Acidobacteriota bacterium]|nr:hypothetical protein [Acidobacteriota bacterium]